MLSLSLSHPVELTECHGQGLPEPSRKAEEPFFVDITVRLPLDTEQAILTSVMRTELSRFTQVYDDGGTAHMPAVTLVSDSGSINVKASTYP
jgi:hypothetical protein